MAHIYISLTDSDDAPWVDILTLQSTGEKFLNVRFGDACSEPAEPLAVSEW